MLVDGGVYDNIGEEWFTPPHGTDPASHNPERRPIVDQLVVISASARERWTPYRASRLPWLGELGAMARSEDVTFAATTALRRRYLVGRWLHAGPHDPTGALVHIAQNPYDVPDDVLRTSTDGDKRMRAEHALRILGDSPDRRSAWDRIVASDQTLRTTLGPSLASRRAADLLPNTPMR